MTPRQRSRQGCPPPRSGLLRRLLQRRAARRSLRWRHRAERRRRGPCCRRRRSGRPRSPRSRADRTGSALGGTRRAGADRLGLHAPATAGLGSTAPVRLVRAAMRAACQGACCGSRSHCLRLCAVLSAITCTPHLQDTASSPCLQFPRRRHVLITSAGDGRSLRHCLTRHWSGMHTRFGVVTHALSRTPASAVPAWHVHCSQHLLILLSQSAGFCPSLA